MSDLAASGYKENANNSQHTWIFQGNPSMYRLKTSLSIEQEEYWNLRQHATKVQLGDRVLIWISGAGAGIYAVGHIVSTITIRPDSAQGLTYWKVPTEGARPQPRALVRYERLLVDRPLLKEFLLTDPILSCLSILRNPRGTNFPVTPEQWIALQPWLQATQ